MEVNYIIGEVLCRPHYFSSRNHGWLLIQHDFAHFVIVPTKTDYITIAGVVQHTQDLYNLPETMGLKAQLAFVLPTMISTRQIMDRQMYDDLINTYGAARRKQFDSATVGLNTSQVRSVATPDSVKAGQYDRKTITLPPKQIRLIDQLRRKEGVGILAFYRWLIDQGLQAYERGARPQPADKVVHEVSLEHCGKGNGVFRIVVRPWLLD